MKLTLEIFQASSNDLPGDIEKYFKKWHETIRQPRPKPVDAIRSIRPEGNPAPELKHTNGLGLPQVLQALQAPSADRYREDTKRLAKINQFLQDVLDNQYAQVMVPHDNSTVHVRLDDHRVLPLDNLGDGIAQLVLIAVLATWYDKHLLCIEEPESNLHPLQLRKLIAYLRSNTTNQYLISTHSAHMLDDPEVAILKVSYDAEQGTQVAAALSPEQRADISQHLGYRASDLLQANAIIWVEGPSDRMYINHWIKQKDQELKEGIHYSIMPYGGSLLKYLTGEESDFLEENVSEFISLIKINRNMVIVMDSDIKTDGETINATKQRVEESFQEGGCIAWVTKGREIENYIASSEFNAAVKIIYPRTNPAATGVRYEDRFESITWTKQQPGPDRIKQPSKVRIAKEITSKHSSSTGVLDLDERIEEIVAYLRRANGLC